MKKILVTGGAGFIGRHVVEELCYRGYKVSVVDNFSYGATNLEGIQKTYPNNLKVHLMDILSPEFTEYLIKERPKTIIHLAAKSHVGHSFETPKEFLEVNLMGTFNLLHTLVRNQIHNHGFRLIHISTDEVCGEVSFLDKPFEVNSPMLPNNPYAASKAAAENLVRAYSQTYGVTSTIVKMCNNFGPNQMTDKLVPATIWSFLNKKRPLVHGKGEVFRSWIPVQITAKKICEILIKDFEPKRDSLKLTYENISSPIKWTNIKMIQEIHNIVRPIRDLGPLEVDYVADRLHNDCGYAMKDTMESNVTYDIVQHYLRDTVNFYLGQWRAIYGDVQTRNRTSSEGESEEG